MGRHHVAGCDRLASGIFLWVGGIGLPGTCLLKASFLKIKLRNVLDTNSRSRKQLGARPLRIIA